MKGILFIGFVSVFLFINWLMINRIKKLLGCYFLIKEGIASRKMKERKAVITSIISGKQALSILSNGEDINILDKGDLKRVNDYCMILSYSTRCMVFGIVPWSIFIVANF